MVSRRARSESSPAWSGFLFLFARRRGLLGVAKPWDSRDLAACCRGRAGGQVVTVVPVRPRKLGTGHGLRARPIVAVGGEACPYAWRTGRFGQRTNRQGVCGRRNGA